MSAPKLALNRRMNYTEAQCVRDHLLGIFDDIQGLLDGAQHEVSMLEADLRTIFTGESLE